MSKVKVMMIDIESNTRFWREVEGRAVSFAEFREYSFILHRSPNNTGLWRISDAITGMYFIEEPTPNKALKSAKEKLIVKGKEKLNEAIEKAHELLKNTPLLDGGE